MRAFGVLIHLLVAMAILGLPDNAASQSAKSAAAQPVNLDDAPVPESGKPDPLAPPEQADRPAPLAPGAPAPVTTSAPSAEVDAVIALVRQRLEHAPVPAGRGGRDDLAAVTAYYSEITVPRRAGLARVITGFAALPGSIAATVPAAISKNAGA